MKSSGPLFIKVVVTMFFAAPAYAQDMVEPAAVAILGATPFAHKAYGINVIKGRAELISEGLRKAKTKVVVKLSGLKPGRKHVGRIHDGGTCLTLTTALTSYTLEPVVADAGGQGVSSTQVSEGLPGVADCEWWIAFHEGSDLSAPKSVIAVGPVLSMQRTVTATANATPSEHIADNIVADSIPAAQ